MRGPEIDSHVLFYGPPGTGKSFLAQEFAINESCAYAFVNFKTKMFTGTSIMKMKKVREEAKTILQQQEALVKIKGGKIKPVVIILDEMDSFGKKDITGFDSSSATEANGLQTLIDEILREKLNIILIGITNHPEMLSEALLRPGRFGRRIKIDYPSEGEIDNTTKYLKKLMEEG